MEKERIDSIFDYWSGPDSDPASAYDYYEFNHSDEYMYLVSSHDDNNFIDYETGTITVNGKTYDSQEMYLLRKDDNHVYLLVDNQEILISWLDDMIDVPWIR